MSATNDFFKEKKNWSIYKDKILSLYLRPYFQKISTSFNKTVYIDGFAGCGLFEDGQKGSPLIVRDIIQDVEKSSTIKEQKIFPFFIENTYAEQLKLNLNSNKCWVRNGDYKKNVNELLDKSTKYNVFLYVDPFGIKDLDFNIFRKLSQNKNSVELLLNLNSFGFIREGCRLLKAPIDDSIDSFAGTYSGDKGANSIDNMNLVADGTEWQDIINSTIQRQIGGKQAEKNFTRLYVSKLGKIFKYVFSIPVRTDDALVPKYQMIYATNNIQGALIMADVMVKCDIDMSDTHKNGQYSFFDYEFKKDEVYDDIKTIIREKKSINMKDLCFALYREQKFYLHKDICGAIKEMEKQGIIKVNRFNKKTPSGKEYKGLDFIKYNIVITEI